VSTKLGLFVLAHLTGIVPSYYLFRWLDRQFAPAVERSIFNHRKRVLMSLFWPGWYIVLAVLSVMAVLVGWLDGLHLPRLRGVQERIGKWFDEGPA
jgi:Na+-translocating ferredoxin:NAD+ oxidoreductase RnfE subunit